MRGNSGIFCLRYWIKAGSSPRVRGTASIGWLRICRPRFIPACAGNSYDPLLALALPPVHPRVCGEQTASTLDVAGTRRFIPACAGNRMDILSSRRRCAVHPRVCGEQTTSTWGGSITTGSSPRVRGTEAISALKIDFKRFIPACAGNSRLVAASRAPETVHPRVCGETAMLVNLLVEKTPVHPRVCGEQLRTDSRSDASRRFIPACAGNRQTALAAIRASAVHPRVCGEQVRGRDCDCPLSGSSPRVRGTVVRERPPVRLKRFIPACAGNRSN